MIFIVRPYVSVVGNCNVGCYLSGVCASIFLYADDIILVAPSVESLQTLLAVCEDYLTSLDMRINVNKSCCLRIGARYDYDCANVMLRSGEQLMWKSSCRYLGVYLLSARSFRCCFDVPRAKFYRAFNGVFGKVGRFASEHVVISLLMSKCLPVLLYATEACPILSRDLSSFKFAVTRVFMKIFRSRSAAVVDECLAMFGVLPLECQLYIRKVNFLREFQVSDNQLCCLFSSDAFGELSAICRKYSTDTSRIIKAIKDSAFS